MTYSLRSARASSSVLRAAFGREDDLGLAVAVAEVDEQHAAVVAVGVDPAAKGHFLADVPVVQFAAGMSPKQRSIPCQWSDQVTAPCAALGLRA